MKRVIAAAAILFLAGCAMHPVAPKTRDEWRALHTHEYKGITVDQALDTAHRVLAAVDPNTNFDFPENELIASRSWSEFLLIASDFGTDYWKIKASPTDSGVSITVMVSREQGSITPSPTLGTTGAINGVGASSTTMPGSNVPWPFTYDLFWKRMDYALGLTKAWYLCESLKALKSRQEEAGSDVLCGNGASEKRPDVHRYSS